MESRDDHFEDLPISINASKSGIYFASSLNSYDPGMRVLATCPDPSPHDPMKLRVLAQVVRVEKLENGKSGLAVHLETSMNFHPGTVLDVPVVVAEDICPSVSPAKQPQIMVEKTIVDREPDFL